MSAEKFGLVPGSESARFLYEALTEGTSMTTVESPPPGLSDANRVWSARQVADVAMSFIGLGVTALRINLGADGFTAAHLRKGLVERITAMRPTAQDEEMAMKVRIGAGLAGNDPQPGSSLYAMVCYSNGGSNFERVLPSLNNNGRTLNLYGNRIYAHMSVQDNLPLELILAGAG